MHFTPTIASLTAFFAASGLAFNIQRQELDKRGDVDVVAAILKALNASPFCSSFVPITDSTVTVTQAGPTGTSQTTVTADCTTSVETSYFTTTTVVPTIVTLNNRAASTTPASPSTTTTRSSQSSASSATTRSTAASASTAAALRVSPTLTATASTRSAVGSVTTQSLVTTAAARTTAVSSKTTKSASTTTILGCKIANGPAALAGFACVVIKEACLAFVKPKIVTATTVAPGITNVGTVTVVPTCSETTIATTVVTSVSIQTVDPAVTTPTDPTTTCYTTITTLTANPLGPSRPPVFITITNPTDCTTVVAA